MNIGSLALNPGAQTDFVLGEEKFSLFSGGLGSGKTFAGLLRMLKFLLQPKPEKVFHPPHGVVGAVSYPALRDVIVPKLQEICFLTGVADWEDDWKRNDMTLTLKNGALMRLRSLDKPDNIIRGPEYAAAFIDEGRNVTLGEWKLIGGRLRQEGYKRGAWVASTPNGYDWMYQVFAEDGEFHKTEYPDSKWYNAPMRENVHLDEDYLAEMEVSYSGRWYEQEVLGKWIGMVSGGVFPEWDPAKFTRVMEFDPSLPLYAGWDFGIGDPGVCLWFQLEWNAVETSPGNSVYLPTIYVLDMMESKDLTSKDWAELYHNYMEDFMPPGTLCRNFGDPAGMQRRVGMNTSVIQDLRTAGVPIEPATRRSPDYAIRILSNMMADGRVFVDSEKAMRVSNALSSYKWNLDSNGVRIGTTPVHDWTSHIVDALRYGVSMIPMSPMETDVVAELAPSPMTYGHVFKQLTEPKVRTRGTFQREPAHPTFVPPPIAVGSGSSGRRRSV